MKKLTSTFDPELFISPKLALIGLAFFDLVLILTGDFLAGPAEPFKMARLGALTGAIIIVAWLLVVWQRTIARWFIIATSVFVVFMGLLWLESNVFLALVVLPVALAAILSGPVAVTVTALGESVLVVVGWQSSFLQVDTGSMLIVIAAIWAMVGIVIAIYQPLYEITHWSWTNYQKARDLLEEVRDRKVELQQALDDLAHAYRELDLLNERVTAMRLVAEEAQAAKTAFVAKVSHEFRTPLNMIIGLTDVVMDTPEVYGDSLSPALLEDLKIVHRNCEHLSKMVNDVLDLSQTELGRLTLRRDWTDLADDIDTALTIVRPLLDKKHLTLQVDIPVDLPQVYCDRTRISQVILNLVSNAVRFTDQGGITVAALRQEQHLVMSVADTGPGVLPEDAQRIFEPFCQGGGNLWRGQEGSGLGLSICKQFVELHGGQMWLESEAGQGSTFFFKLPISLPHSSSGTSVRWINQNWVWHERTSRSKLPQSPYKQRVLICDDSGDLYHSLSHCDDTVEFIKADNLECVIHEAQAVPAHAVIINTASIHQAGSLCDRVRQDLPDTPIIIGTFPSRMKHILETGAVNYLIKPILPVDLERAIEALDQPIKCVLIADDDLDLRQLLKRMLLIYDATLEIVMASSGEHALAQLHEHAPDLMLIDIAMPDMDGWHTLQRKQQDESIKDIPTIIVSAQDPAGQPMTSQSLSVTMGPGISVDKFLKCSLELSSLLLEPD